MTDDPEAPNEILAEVKAHARVAEQAVVEKTKNWPIVTIGLAAGIGSAAVAAAVMYTRRRGEHGND